MDDDQTQAAAARVGMSLRDGKYRLERLLGVGGMAAVYEGMHRNGRRVAIKLLHPHLASNRELRRRFLREGLAANRVNHPGAVTVLDDDVAEDGAAFLVMELLQGESVEELFERYGQRLPLSIVLPIGIQLCEVLAAAHRAQIIHRDIKPANLFITTDGQLKVLDFGIARMFDPERTTATMAGMVFGTPAFMPPEQAAGKTTEVDGQSDLWAVGATLFTLLSGRVVFDAPTAEEMIRFAKSNAAPRLSAVANVEPKIAEIVDRALAADKFGRWSDCAELGAALRSAAQDAFGGQIPSLAHARRPLRDTELALTALPTRSAASTFRPVEADSTSETRPIALRTSRARRRAIPYWLSACILVSAMALFVLCARKSGVVEVAAAAVSPPPPPPVVAIPVLPPPPPTPVPPVATIPTPKRPAALKPVIPAKQPISCSSPSWVDATGKTNWKEECL